MTNSVLFDWDPSQFNNLVDSCKCDDGVQIALRILHGNYYRRILEAGCGSGRVVKYLTDRGYRFVDGIEANTHTVLEAKKIMPFIHHGDVSDMFWDDDTFDFVLSFGVIEHFPSGPQEPLKEMLRVLRPGGTAIVTVPSFNLVRQKKYKKEPNDKYYVFKVADKFFEYRFTPEEFRFECLEAGFEIVGDEPISHLDGMYHELLAPIGWKDWKFSPSDECLKLNEEYKKIPFYHNHMHCAVLRKS